MFNNPFVQQVLNKAATQFTQIVDAIPDSYGTIKNNINASITEYEQMVQSINEVPAQDLSNNVKHRNALEWLETEARQLEDPQQSLFDNNIFQRFLQYKNDNEQPTAFTDWYLQQLIVQYRYKLLELEISMAQSLATVSTDVERKIHLMDYQTNILNIQEQWFDFITTYLSQQQHMVQELQMLLMKYQRQSDFAINNVSFYTRISQIMTWIVVFTMICWIAYLLKKYQDHILLLATSLSKK